MRYLRGIVTWIDSFKSGRQFRSWTIIALKILGAVVSVGISVWSIVVCVNTIDASKNTELTSWILVIIGSILEVCLILPLATLLAMLFWNRANKIRTLKNDPNFFLISTAVILVQLLGEMSFLGLVVGGIQTLVASIFGSGIPRYMEFLLYERRVLGAFPTNPVGDITFIFGVILSVTSVLSGAVLLITAYFIAEEINVFANIAKSLNNIETKLVDEGNASDSSTTLT